MSHWHTESTQDADEQQVGHVPVGAAREARRGPRSRGGARRGRGPVPPSHRPAPRPRRAPRPRPAAGGSGTGPARRGASAGRGGTPGRRRRSRRAPRRSRSDPGTERASTRTVRAARTSVTRSLPPALMLPAAPATGRAPAGPPRGRPSGRRVLEGPADAVVHPLQVALQRRPPLGRDVLHQVLQQRPHAPHDLDRVRAAVPDLVEGEDQEVLPLRDREHEAEAPPPVAHAPRREVHPAEAEQEVLHLVEGLHGGRGVVDGRRERLDRDVHEDADRVLGVLLERALRPEPDEPPQPALGHGPPPAVDAQERHAVDERVADRPRHRDDRPFPPGERDEALHVDGLDDRGAAAVEDDLPLRRQLVGRRLALSPARRRRAAA